MKISYYDICVNIFSKQFTDPLSLVEKSRSYGVEPIIVSSSVKDVNKIQDFLLQTNTYGTVGVHPHNADSVKESNLELIKSIASSNSHIIAIGECGLDYDRMFSTKSN